MKIPKAIHIVPDLPDWRVERAGAKRASSRHKSQAAAVSAGRRLAKKHRAELIVHSHTGKIEWRNSHGHDPYPPEG